MQLTPIETRILGCLLEKEATTPAQYPLSTKALQTACNQSTNRDPVMELSVGEVDQALLELRQGGWARTIKLVGQRAEKHRHVVDEVLGVSGAESAVLCVLMVRGPQTPGELRTRTERSHPFADVAAVEAVLNGLAGRSSPLVRCIGRSSGQQQDRWMHLLADESFKAPPGAPERGAAPALLPVNDGPQTPVGTPARSTTSDSGGAAVIASPSRPAALLRPPEVVPASELAAVLERVEQLERKLARIESELGM